MDRESGSNRDYWATEVSAQKNAASTFWPTQQGEQTAPRINLTERFNETLGQLGHALEMAGMIEDRIFGPAPRAVNQMDKEASQPHFVQYVDMLQARAIELTQRINRIAAAL